MTLAEFAGSPTHELLEELWVSVDAPLMSTVLDTIWVVPTQAFVVDTEHPETLVLAEPPLKVTWLFGA